MSDVPQQKTEGPLQSLSVSSPGFVTNNGTGGHVIHFPPPNGANYFQYTDDFSWNCIASQVGAAPPITYIGELLWGLLTQANHTVVVGETSHPGIINLFTAAIAFDINYINQAGAGALIPADIGYMAGVFRPTAAATNLQFLFGIDNGFSADESGQGIYFTLLTGTSPNFRTTTNDGVATTNQTAIPYVVGTWYLLEIIRNGTNWEFWINGVLQFTHATHIPTIPFSIPVFELMTLDGVSKGIDMDLIVVRSINPLGARF